MSKSKGSKPVLLVVPEQQARKRLDSHLTGSGYESFNFALLNSLFNTLNLNSSDETVRQQFMKSALEAMAGLAPKDEAEGMSAAQMVACHNAAMDCYRRAMLPEQTIEGRKMNLSFATKLSRTYALHMEALDKHRGKGQQKVTVEHVHVHQGGQAIVGTVNHPGPGGVVKNPEEQPYAESIAHAPEPEMRSALPEDREAVPERRDAKR